MDKAAAAEEYAKQIKEAWRFGVLGVYCQGIQVTPSLFVELPGEENIDKSDPEWTQHNKQYNGNTYFTLIKNKEGEENQAL
jgi:hypothetical protein